MGAPVAPGVERSAGGAGPSGSRTLAFAGGRIAVAPPVGGGRPGVEFRLRRLHIRVTGFGRGGTPHIRQFGREFSELG